MSSADAETAPRADEDADAQVQASTSGTANLLRASSTILGLLTRQQTEGQDGIRYRNFPGPGTGGSLTYRSSVRGRVCSRVCSHLGAVVPESPYRAVCVCRLQIHNCVAENIVFGPDCEYPYHFCALTGNVALAMFLYLHGVPCSQVIRIASFRSGVVLGLILVGSTIALQLKSVAACSAAWWNLCAELTQQSRTT